MPSPLDRKHSVTSIPSEPHSASTRKTNSCKSRSSLYAIHDNPGSSTSQHEPADSHSKTSSTPDGTPAPTSALQCDAHPRTSDEVPLHPPPLQSDHAPVGPPASAINISESMNEPITRPLAEPDSQPGYPLSLLPPDVVHTPANDIPPSDSDLQRFSPTPLRYKQLLAIPVSKSRSDFVDVPPSALSLSESPLSFTPRSLSTDSPSSRAESGVTLVDDVYSPPPKASTDAMHSPTVAQPNSVPVQANVSLSSRLTRQHSITARRNGPASARSSPLAQEIISAPPCGPPKLFVNTNVRPPSRSVELGFDGRADSNFQKEFGLPSPSWTKPFEDHTGAELMRKRLRCLVSLYCFDNMRSARAVPPSASTHPKPTDKYSNRAHSSSTIKLLPAIPDVPLSASDAVEASLVAEDGMRQKVRE